MGDGAYFGFLRAIDSRFRTLDFDVAQWFKGKSARQAAVADQADPELDVYVRNQSGLVRTLTVSPTVVVTVARCGNPCLGQFRGTFEALTQSFGPTANSNPTLADAYRGPHSQYWVTVENGEVIRIDEQYIS